jgi:hypothetical protein
MSKLRDIEMRTQSKDNEKLKKENDTLNAEKNTLQSENDLLKTRVEALELEHVVLKCKYDTLVATNNAFLKSENVSRADLRIDTESLKADKLVLEMKYKTLALENVNLHTEKKEMLRDINLLNLRFSNLLEIQKKSNGSLCPITHEVMTDPVIAMDGFTYNKVGLDGWISVKAKNRESLISPLTGAIMGETYVPNYALKDSNSPDSEFSGSSAKPL